MVVIKDEGNEIDNEIFAPPLHIQLRNKFLEEYDPSSDTYEPEDVECVKTDDYYCERFLLHTKGDFNNAFLMLKESLSWRKSFGVKTCTQDSIPAEFFEARAAFPYNTDKDGFPIMLLLIRFHKKNSEYAKDMRRFVIYWVEKMLADSGGSQMTVIMNCLNAGISNLDLDLIKFLITLFRSYYPHSLARILVFEMPWILNATWRLIKTWLPEDFVEKIVFVDRTSVLEFIDKENLHVEMGGTSTLEYVPPIFNQDQNSNLIVDNKETDPKKDISPTNPKVRRKTVDKDHLLMTDDYCILAGILKISPPACLTFYPPLAKDETTEASIKLSNCSDKIITFKVKTNNIENYRVKPSIGIIEPNESIDISVFLLQGQKPQPSDKFLILTMKMPSVSAPNPSVSNLWKSTSIENAADHKLRCALGTHETEKVEYKIEDALKGVNSVLANLNKKVERLEANQRWMMKLQMMTSVGILIFLLIFSLTSLIYMDKFPGEL